MLLYIVRHGAAGQHGDPRFPDDSLRPLTDKGRKRFSRLVKKLVRRDFAPTLVASSPLVRCRQTAQVIVDRLPDTARLWELPDLAPGGDLDKLIAWTNEQLEPAVAWVGHAPDVGELASALVSNGSAEIEMAKGAIAAIEFAGESVVAGQGTLNWLVHPKLP